MHRDLLGRENPINVHTGCRNRRPDGWDRCNGELSWVSWRPMWDEMWEKSSNRRPPPPYALLLLLLCYYLPYTPYYSRIILATLRYVQVNVWYFSITYVKKITAPEKVTLWCLLGNNRGKESYEVRLYPPLNSSHIEVNYTMFEVW